MCKKEYEQPDPPVLRDEEMAAIAQEEAKIDKELALVKAKLRLRRKKIELANANTFLEKNKGD